MRPPARTTRLAAVAAALTAATILTAGAPARLAAQTPDAEGDFLPAYAGPRPADLDGRSVRFTYDRSAAFGLSSTACGAIGTTPGAALVSGIDRGDGRADFARLGLPDVRFDFPADLVPDGTSLHLDLVTGEQGRLPPGAVRCSGALLEATLPATLLPSYGRAPAAYTANLLAAGLSLVVGLSHATQPRAWAALFVRLRGWGRAGALVNGLVSLAFGAVVVVWHPTWAGPGAALTALGWAQVAKGCLGLLLPRVALRSLARVSPERPGGFVAAGIALVAASVVFGYAALAR